MSHRQVPARRRVSAALIAFSTFFAACAAAQGQASWDDVSKINKWFDEHKGPYNVQKSGGVQTPGNMQQPGNIQIPRGAQAIKAVKSECKEKLIVCADTLFEFDKATLSPDAEATLKLLGPKILALGPHPVFIDGHTDSKGDDEYNQQLSVRRAERVKNWLMSNHFVGKEALVQGWGEKKPIAPNTKPDGKDNPLGRQQNRRVEIIVDTCKTLETAGTTPPPAVPAQPTDTAPAAGETSQATPPPAAKTSDVAQPAASTQPKDASAPADAASSKTEAGTSADPK